MMAAVRPEAWVERCWQHCRCSVSFFGESCYLESPNGRLFEIVRIGFLKPALIQQLSITVIIPACRKSKLASHENCTAPTSPLATIRFSQTIAVHFLMIAWHPSCFFLSLEGSYHVPLEICNSIESDNEPKRHTYLAQRTT
jgi:hypothetical protein